jgi:hypothetical protein
LTSFLASWTILGVFPIIVLFIIFFGIPGTSIVDRATVDFRTGFWAYLYVIIIVRFINAFKKRRIKSNLYIKISVYIIAERVVKNK